MNKVSVPLGASAAAAAIAAVSAAAADHGRTVWLTATLLLAGACIALALRLLELQRELAAARAPVTPPRRPRTAPRDDLSVATPTIRIESDGDAAWPLEDIEAYLVDLDGTIYSPNGPIPGAAEFYASVLRHRPHVFLSNTGAKGADGVRSKLARNGIIMSPEGQAKHIYTAAQAQCRYMIDVIPRGARVFVIAGGDADGPGSYWMSLLQQESAELVSSWSLRSHLTDGMAREWASAAAAGRPVFVVLFSDGSISAVTDPGTGEAGFADWSYDVIKKTSFVLAHGAELIATAEDAFNPSTDNMPLPGPGMFCAMFRKLLHPLGQDRLHICGKGGREGEGYMVGRALEMLRAQGWSGDASKVLIIGDRFDTDIRAGALAGLRTCLVESGCHSTALQHHFADARADFAAASIAELIPPHRRSAGERWRKVSFENCAKTIRPAALPLLRQSSDRPTDRLRAWQLGHGNLVYQASSGSVQGPLIQMLRMFFDQHSRRSDDAEPADGLPTISAADALEAMAALGVIPPQLPDGRPLHRFPFDVTAGNARVTFAALCREVQRSLESTGAPRPSFVFDEPQPASPRPAGGSPPLRRSPSRPRLDSPGATEAPAMLQSPVGGSEAPRRAGRIAPCASDTSLETLAERWPGRGPVASRPLGGTDSRRIPPAASDTTLASLEKQWRETSDARGEGSRVVSALVDRRFRYLGKE